MTGYKTLEEDLTECFKTRRLTVKAISYKKDQWIITAIRDKNEDVVRKKKKVDKDVQRINRLIRDADEKEVKEIKEDAKEETDDDVPKNPKLMKKLQAQSVEQKEETKDDKASME